MRGVVSGQRFVWDGELTSSARQGRVPLRFAAFADDGPPVYAGSGALSWPAVSPLSRDDQRLAALRLSLLRVPSLPGPRRLVQEDPRSRGAAGLSGPAPLRGCVQGGGRIRLASTHRVRECQRAIQGCARPATCHTPSRLTASGPNCRPSVPPQVPGGVPSHISKGKGLSTHHDASG